MAEQNKNKTMTDDDAISDLESEEEENTTIKSFGSGSDMRPTSANRVVSEDGVTDDDSDEDDDVEVENPRSSSLRKTDSQKRRSSKKDVEPPIPRRGKSHRAGVDEEVDEDPVGKPRRSRSSDIAGCENSSGDDVTGKPKKVKRRGTKSEVVGDVDEGDDTPSSSFHKLAKDADKKLGSNSKSNRTKRSGSSGSSGRRRAKEQTVEVDDALDDDIDEFGEEEHEIELKGDDDDLDTSGAGPRQLSSAKRPPSSRRSQTMRRSSSERFRRALEGDSNDDDDLGKNLSRSSHGSGRRRASSSENIGSTSYHGGSERNRTRTPNKRPSRRSVQTPNSDGSGENYDHELSMSGRSSRTLDSIEDLEDFEHIDFQTPGMANYDAKIMELMRKANPEHTAQLQRRVGRRREAVNYDQNMPMMTRQALLTRTASTQVQRQFVDQSTLDKRNMLVRSMSNSSMSVEELSMSQHRQQMARAPPARRPPPRTRSSGMALSMTEHPSDDKRRLFRTKSGASTSSFRQTQKPNRVQPISRRPGEMDTSRSNRGAPEDRKGSLSRARSMHATVGRTAFSPNRPERRVPKTVDPKPTHESSREKHSSKDDDSDISEDSDVESDEESVKPKVAPVKLQPKPILPPRKKTDKRDFTVKRNRAKLHSMIYESKMGVDMHDLLETVRQGEVPRSPWKALMMPSP